MKNIKNWSDFTNESLLSKILPNKKDHDLGNKIVTYLRDKFKNSNYKDDSKFNKEDINRAGNTDGFFFFTDKIYAGEYRFDIVKVSSSINKEPYQVHISKVENSQSDLVSDSDFDDLLSRYVPVNRKGQNIGNITTSKKEGVKKLYIDQSLAKKIYELAEQIWEKTNKNVITTARDGVSTKSISHVSNFKSKIKSIFN